MLLLLPKHSEDRYLAQPSYGESQIDAIIFIPIVHTAKIILEKFTPVVRGTDEVLRLLRW